MFLLINVYTLTGSADMELPASDTVEVRSLPRGADKASLVSTHLAFPPHVKTQPLTTIQDPAFTQTTAEQNSGVIAGFMTGHSGKSSIIVLPQKRKQTQHPSGVIRNVLIGLSSLRPVQGKHDAHLHTNERIKHTANASSRLDAQANAATY